MTSPVSVTAAFKQHDIPLPAQLIFGMTELRRGVMDRMLTLTTY
jgi:hypothetical protein